MHAIATMCRVLGVSASGYYARLTRPPAARARADAELSARIAAIHQRSRATYGAPRIHAELAAEGLHVGCKRVARLMKAACLYGVSRRQWVTTTVRDRDARPAPDLVERNFVAAAPNRLWVADITYIPTWAGFLYLAVMLDAFSRRIVGWAMETHLRSELVLQALNLALWQRRPKEVIHHSDQGSQYTSLAFGQRCRKVEVRLGRTSSGLHRESTASCSCLGSRFPRRPYPPTWRPCTEVPGNRGGRLFAIRRSPSDTGTILSTPTKTRRAARTARIVAI